MHLGDLVFALRQNDLLAYGRFHKRSLFHFRLVFDTHELKFSRNKVRQRWASSLMSGEQKWDSFRLRLSTAAVTSVTRARLSEKQFEKAPNIYDEYSMLKRTNHLLIVHKPKLYIRLLALRSILHRFYLTFLMYYKMAGPVSPLHPCCQRPINPSSEPV
jgi:hypothetical protein